MKKAEDLKLKMVICLTIVIILALSIPPMQALAQDADLDGFTDSLESTGIMLRDGTIIPACPPNVDIATRPTCVDPATRDLFVILLKGDNTMNPTYGLGPSLMPTNPLEFLSNPKTAGGLGVATHVITPTQQYPYYDRIVTSSSPTQKAVRVTESLDPNSDKLGVTTGQGMFYDESTVYTMKIKNFIISVCGTNFANGNPLCKDSTGLTGQALLDKYIKHTIAHEIGHSLSLTGRSVKNYGGYHYNTTDNVEMSQSVYYTKNSQTGATIFYIGTGFISTDQSGFTMK
jgi:hypothetical protein